MADILLSFGLKHNAALDENLAGDLSAAIKKVEASAPKIKVGVQIDPNSLNTFKSQLTKIVNSVTTGTGKPISLKIDGLGNITADADKAANAVKKVGDAAKQAAAEAGTVGNKVSGAFKTKTLDQLDKKIEKLKKNLQNWSAASNSDETAGYYDELTEALNRYVDARKRIELLDVGKKDDVINSKLESDIMSEIKLADDIASKAARGIKDADKATKSLGARIGSLAGKFTTWLSVSQVIMQIFTALKQMVTTAIEVDTAMTELKKVTNETDSTYDKFLNNAANRAKNLGATLTDVVNASASFARLGYDIDEATNLADTAIVYKNVADDIESIDVASASITSTMQAFGIEADNAMIIVDKFNEVSNNYAITSGGLGEALQRSASAMYAAGNTLDQTIAMITAANTIVQNPESVGTTMKTISMYLRSAKTEAEAAGESTEGMAESTSKLREEILDLTGEKVDIQLDENTFKSTYQILKELADVWDELSDISQANILEMIGGKRNANVTAALLEQFDLVEDIVRTSEDSYGSALEENAKYLESIQGHISQFKAAFQALSETAANGDLIKDFIDLGTGFLNTANAVISLTDSLVGLENILKIIVGYKAIDIIQDLSGGSTLFKALYIDTNTKFGSFLKGLSDRAGSGAGKWKELASSWDSAASAGANLKNVMSSLAQSANPVKLAIASVVIGYEVAMAASNAYTEYRQSLKQNFDDDVVSFKDSKKELESYKNEIISLKSVISDRNSSTSDVTAANERLVEIERSLLDTYEAQAVGLNLLASSADSAAEAINGLVEAEAAAALSDNSKMIEQVTDRMERSRVENEVAYGLINGKEFFDIQRIFEKYGYSIDRVLPGVTRMTLEGTAEDLVNNTQEMEDALLHLRDVYADNDEWIDVSPVIEALSKIRLSNQAVLSEYASDYSEIIEWKYASGGVSDGNGEIVLYKDLLDEVTNAQNEFNDAVSRSYTTQDEKNKAIGKALVHLNDVEDKINSMKWEVEDIGVKNDLIDIIDSVWTFAEDLPTPSWKSAADTVDAYSTALSNLQSEQEALSVALSEQSSGSGLSPETYSALINASSDYSNALEYEAGVYRINADVANAYLDAKVAANTLELSGRILAETKEYEKNNNELEELNKEYDRLSDKRSKQARDIRDEITALEQQQSEIKSNITSYKLLRTQLLEMSSAYGKWQAAQQSSESGDMYDNLKTALDQIKDGLKTGKTGTDKYKASVKMLVALDDPSPKEVQKYMTKLSRYITKDSSGAKNFINDMIKNGFMHGSNGAVATWNDAWMNEGVTAEQICEALEITPSMAKAIFGELEEYHFDFNWNEGTFDILAIKDIMSALDAGVEKYKAELEANPEIAPEISTADFDNFVNRAKGAFEDLFTIDPEIEPMAYEKAIREFEAALGEGLDLGIDLEALGFTQELLSGLGITLQSNEAAVEIERTQGLAESLKTSVIDLAAQSIGDLGASTAAYELQGVLTILQTIENFSFSNKIVPVTVGGTLTTSSTTSGSGPAGAAGIDNAVGGRTLVGEVGRELVISRGRYYTVGERGAEFVNLKRGDIVLNHADTERVLGGSSRTLSGQALAGGTNALKDFTDSVAAGIAKWFGVKPYNMYDVYQPSSTTDWNDQARDEKFGHLDGGNTTDGYYKAQEEKFDLINDKGITPPGMGGMGPTGGGKNDYTGSEDSTGAGLSKEDFEKLYKEHQHLLAMDKENTAEYLDWLEGAYKLAFEEGTEEYWKYEEEVYKGRQDLFKDSLGDKEHFISMLVADDTDASTIINNYEMLIKSVEAELERAYAQGLDDNDDYVQELKDKLVDYKDEIKSINDDINEDAKDSYEDLIEYRKDMLKQALEDEKENLNDQLSALQDFYDKQRDMLQDEYDEEKYLEEQAEKEKAVADIKAEMEMLERDDSAYAQRRKLELLEDLKDAEKDLADFEKEHALKMAKETLDKQQELQEEDINKKMEAIDESLDNEKALRLQAIEDLQNGDLELYNEMIAYNAKHGDGNDQTVADMWNDAYTALSKYYELYSKLYEGMYLENVNGLTGVKALPIPAGSGYASGTSSATTGIHEIMEDASEYIFASSNGRRYKMFTGGEKVLDAASTNFLYNFATNGSKILSRMLADAERPIPSNISGQNRIFDIRMGDIIVQGNATERTVSEIRRAQRESVDFMLKEFNKLKNK